MVDEKVLEACRLWVERDFSLIPTSLIEKAYFGENKCGDEITILAPSFENFKAEYMKENCLVEGYEGDPCSVCRTEYCQEAYYESVSKIPMWGYVFVPENSLDREWIKNNAEKVAKLGFIVYETDEIGVYLGINGAGYDFYEHHWVPLYLERGLKWHEKG